MLRRCAPDVKVIAISDYAFRAGMTSAPDFFRMAVDFGAASCLRKPFGAGELAGAVEAVAPAARLRRRTG